MLRRYWFNIVILSLANYVSGCSTIISSKFQSVTFQSTPPGATVNINGLPIGLTPFTTLIEKKNAQTLTINKVGYKTYTTSMETSIDPWFWGNIIFGVAGIYGFTTDGFTGAMHEYAPSQFLVTIEPEGSTKVESSTLPSKKDKAREFIIVNYHQISSELNKGAGSYLSSLLVILQIPKYTEDSSIKQLKTMSDEFNDIAQFADQVTAAYLK